MNVYNFDDTILVAAVDAKTARRFVAVIKDDWSYLYNKLRQLKKLNKKEVESVMVTPEEYSLNSKPLSLILDEKLDLDAELISEGNWEYK